ncbi:uncharacterized protein BCR38DRAFT_472943 [Pseudomassariella vexata]|uniref:Uncharacterized protein n=1 Tax=Pseudomassariella vexata TaxID=1141098 RepID=A0A1Y2E8C5_9PEZI|nr:uncharacterized protein BCR38DRAFT_472943 [Pseudomassariella vexata]ORY67574.1 hypothetical protein BCR38DRAFT_472943 [Pseudomassariella vexata]
MASSAESTVSNTPSPSPPPTEFFSHDIKPKIHAQNVQAVSEWIDNDGATRSLGDAANVTMDLHFEPSASSAFFKLRVPCFLKHNNTVSKSPTSLFVFITPDRIQQLAIEDEQSSHKNKLRNTTICLRFTLTKPCDLVGPRHMVPLRAKNAKEGAVLDSLRALAQQTCFAVRIACRVLSKAQRHTLARAVSSSPGLAPTAGHDSLSSLYNGKGGIVHQFDGDKDKNEDCPPAYADIGPPAPAPPLDDKIPAEKEIADSAFLSRSRKRPRGASSSDADIEDNATNPKSDTKVQRLEAENQILRKQVEALSREVAAMGDRILELSQRFEVVEDEVSDAKVNITEELRDDLRRNYGVN